MWVNDSCRAEAGPATGALSSSVFPLGSSHLPSLSPWAPPKPQLAQAGLIDNTHSPCLPHAYSIRLELTLNCLVSPHTDPPQRTPLGRTSGPAYQRAPRLREELRLSLPPDLSITQATCHFLVSPWATHAIFRML